MTKSNPTQQRMNFNISLEDIIVDKIHQGITCDFVDAIDYIFSKLSSSDYDSLSIPDVILQAYRHPQVLTAILMNVSDVGAKKIALILHQHKLPITVDIQHALYSI